MKAKFINEDNFEQGMDPKRAMGIGQQKFLDAVEGIDAFTHWLYYVDENFIQEVWGKDTMLGNHLQEKFDGIFKAMDDDWITPYMLIKFVRELDTENQHLLYEYIIENHNNKW